ncbi:MAG: hypothetical protein ACKPJF_15230 [Dolichospermum sp.]
MTNLAPKGISSPVSKINREDGSFRLIRTQPQLSYRISSSLANCTGEDDDPIVPPS